jgi:hypothetical protein
MIIQAGIRCKWASDSRKFLLEHFHSTHNSPSHTYHSALPFCLPSSWIYKCYNGDSSQEVKVPRHNLLEDDDLVPPFVHPPGYVPVPDAVYLPNYKE